MYENSEEEMECDEGTVQNEASSLSSDSDDSLSSSGSSSDTTSKSDSDTGSNMAVAGGTLDEMARREESASGGQSGLNSNNTSTYASQPELRRKYSELIETCQGFEEREGFDGNLHQDMRANIKEGKQLFNQIGGGPGDMYMAFLHTRMFSGMLRCQTEIIGSATSGFKLESYLESLKTLGLSENGEFKPNLLAKSIAIKSALTARTLPIMVALIGTFDENAIANPPVVKEKKTRAAPRRKQFDEDCPTLHEDVNITEEQKNQKDKNSPETLSQEMFKILKGYHLKRYKENKRLTNIFEFTLDKNSLVKSIEYLFYMGFLVRDGYASLTRIPSTIGKTNDSTLVIKPDKPPSKKAEDKDMLKTRNQYILTFSPVLFKKLAQIAEGEDIITAFKEAQSKMERLSQNRTVQNQNQSK